MRRVDRGRTPCWKLRQAHQPDAVAVEIDRAAGARFVRLGINRQLAFNAAGTGAGVVEHDKIIGFRIDGQSRSVSFLRL